MFTEILPRMCIQDNSLQITLFTVGRNRLPLPVHEQIRHLQIPALKIPFLPISLREFFISKMQPLILGTGKAQIWHTTYFTTPTIWKGLRIVTVYDMIHERFSHLFNRPEDDIFRKQKRTSVLSADALICISRTTYDDLISFYGISKDSVYTIPNGYSNIFTQKDRFENHFETPFLLYVGDRTHYKNFKMLIRVYSQWNLSKDIALFVVGEPWTSFEAKKLLELRIKDRVKLFTNIDDRMLCDLYNQATAFIHPSLYEGFGIPLLEAMACGCRIIASRIPSTVEIARNYPIYFDPINSDELLHALDRAICESQTSESTTSGIALARKYSWDETSRKTLSVYRDLLA